MNQNTAKKPVVVSQEGQPLALQEPTMELGIVPQNITDAMQLARIIASSDICPKDFRSKPGNVLVAMQMGAELGLKPMQALQNIAVINGRPSVWGDAMLAIVKGHYSCEYVDEAVKDGVATCIAKRKGQPPVTRTFSMEDAKTARLDGKDGPWKQYPKRMLQMRARGFALRDCWPDLLRGIITSEEAGDTPTDDVWKEALSDDASETATEKLKKKLKNKAAPAEDFTLTIALDAIKAAGNMQELGSIGVQCKGLLSKDKATAKKAYAEKKALLESGADPQQTEQADNTREILLTQLYEGIGVIGDQKWECIRAELGLPKSTDGYSVDQIKQAILEVNKEADFLA